MKTEKSQTLYEIFSEIYGQLTNKPLFSVNDTSGKVDKFYKENWREIDKLFMDSIWPECLKKYTNNG